MIYFLNIVKGLKNQMKFVLICEKCRKIFQPESGYYVCPICNGRLKIDYKNYNKFGENHTKIFNGIWRYHCHLPIEKENFISLGEGNTPLLNVNKNYFNVNLWIKNETINPTGTYKDRPASVGVTRAKELNAKGIVVASDGNTGPAVAAYSARADLPCIVLMPKSTPSCRYTQAASFGAKIFLIDGSINDCIDLSNKITEINGYHNCTTASTINPYQIEANKTISYEIVEKLGYSPDWIAVPIGGGGLLVGMMRGFQELYNSKKITSIPRILAVQAEKCSPFVNAYENNKNIMKWEGDFETIAFTIAVPYPLDGDIGVEFLKQSGGHAIAIKEKEILESVKKLARNIGILAEPAGGISFAGILKACQKSIIKKEENCVAIITGTGLKSMEIFNKIQKLIYTFPNDVKRMLDFLD